MLLQVTHIPFSKFGHYFDLSKTMAPELIQNVKWDGFFIPEEAGLDIDEKSWWVHSSWAEKKANYKNMLTGQVHK